MPTPVINTIPINARVGTIIDPTGELGIYGIQGTNIPSNNTTDLAGIDGFYINITGTTTIISLGVANAGVPRFVTFTGSLTLTHNAISLILPTGTNIVTAPGDCAMFMSLGNGNWKCVGFLRISGKALSNTKDDIGLSDVENTALSTWAGSANITTLGTIVSGIWHASTIGTIYGGTNLTSYTLGDVLYANAADSLAKLPKDTNATRYFANTGVANIPKWDQVNLTNGVTGVLPPANGGTGFGVQSPTDPAGTTLTIDFALGNIAKVNLASASGNITLTLNNPLVGQLCMLEVTQGVTARTIIFPSGTKQALIVGNTWTSTGASKTDVINLYYNGTNYVIVGTVPNIG